MSESEVSTINLELGVFPIVGLPVMKDAVEETFNDELFKISSKWIKGSDKKTFPEIQDVFIKNNPTLAEIRRGIKTTHIIPKLLTEGGPMGVNGILEEIQNILANKDIKEKEKLKKWEETARSKEGEVDVTLALALLFSGQNASIFHGLQTGEYLSMFFKKNKQVTNARKPSDGLSSIERKLCQLLKIDLDSFMSVSSLKFSEIKSKFEELKDIKEEKEIRSYISSFKPVILSKMIKNIFELRELKNIDSKQSSNKSNVVDYLLKTSDEVFENMCRIAYLKTKRQEFSSEVDNIVILPQQKIILQMETKTVSQSTNRKTLLNQIKNGAMQTKTTNTWMEIAHGDILGQDYHYIRSIVLPNQTHEDLEQFNLDSLSKQFIVTREELSNPKKMRDWWEEIFANNFHLKNRPLSREASHNPISPSNLLIARLFMGATSIENWSMTKLESSKCVAHSIIGSYDISPGMTYDTMIKNPGDITLHSLKKQPVGSLCSWIFWNPPQAALLHPTKRPRKVTLIGDAGLGKTLILKHIARIMSLSGCQTSFGSFASFNKDWLPRTMTSLVDLSAEEEFKLFDENGNKTVEFVGLKQFQKARQKNSELKLFPYLIKLVKQNPKTHFYFDELMSGYGINETKLVENFLTKIMKESAENQCVWVALRMDQTYDKVNGGNSGALKSLKNSLKQIGWTVPDLTNNMRNSASIARIANKLKTPIGSPQKGRPCTTVYGFSPVLITIGKDFNNKLDSEGAEKALEEAIREHLDLNLNEDFLTIITNEKEVCTVVKKMPYPCFEYWGAEQKHDGHFIKEEMDKREEDARKFLENPNKRGILLTDMHLMSGMETRDLVLVMGPGYEVRDSLMRTVSRLVLITTQSWLGESSGHFMLGGNYTEIANSGKAGEPERKKSKC